MVIELIPKPLAVEKVRFKLTQSIAADGHIRFAAGEIVSNFSPNADPRPWFMKEPEDRHWPGLTAQTMAPGMVPQDDASQRMKDQSAFAGEVISATICGADSIR